MNNTRWWRGAGRPAIFLVLPPLLVVGMLGLAPLVLILVWSFWSFDPDTYWIKPEWTLSAYAALFTTGRLPVLVRTALLAGGTASICTVLAFPCAFAASRMTRPRAAAVLLALFTIPFFTSALVRAFSWRLVLGRTGLVNQALLYFGVIDAPLEWLLFSNFAVVLGMIAAYLPFAIVPMLIGLARIEPSVVRASHDLGAGFWTTLRHVVLPLAMPGVVTGFLFVFVVGLGTSTEIQLLGGAGDSSISIMINDVMRVVDFPLAFAIATTVVALLLAVLVLGEQLLHLSRMFADLG